MMQAEGGELEQDLLPPPPAWLAGGSDSEASVWRRA